MRKQGIMINKSQQKNHPRVNQEVNFPQPTGCSNHQVPKTQPAPKK